MTGTYGSVLSDVLVIDGGEKISKLAWKSFVTMRFRVVARGEGEGSLTCTEGRVPPVVKPKCLADADVRVRCAWAAGNRNRNLGPDCPCASAGTTLRRIICNAERGRRRARIWSGGVR